MKKLGLALGFRVRVIQNVFTPRRQRKSERLSCEFEDLGLTPAAGPTTEAVELAKSFEVPVDVNLKSLILKPFGKHEGCGCCPIRVGKNKHSGVHHRGFWFATLSFFIAFVGWFSFAPLLGFIKVDLGLCSNMKDVNKVNNDGVKVKCVCKDEC